MKIKLKGFITSKESELYSDCADHYAFSTENLKFAISDGVSRSFFPKFWSRILVERYVEKDTWKEEDFILSSQEHWQNKVDEIVKSPDTMYFTRNAYNRKTPGLATFVGLQFLPKEKKWIAQALGDSFLFFVPKDCQDFDKDAIKLSSKDEPFVFDNYPDYLSSIGDSHKGNSRKIKGQELRDGTFYLMTDALAEWFLQGKGIENAITTIENIKNQEQFLETIDNERKANRLHNDDSALLIIEVSNTRKQKVSFSEIEVSNLKNLIEIQSKEIEKEEKKKEDEEKLEISSSLSSVSEEINQKDTEPETPENHEEISELEEENNKSQEEIENQIENTDSIIKENEPKKEEEEKEKPQTRNEKKQDGDEERPQSIIDKF
ncbi:hypothetical protein H4O20_12580 [Aequorivita sp. 609]|uniref:hypothetical protein n=1 Tax=Aequorivita TaxID=153265 RepID=UPI0016202C7C|nr:MULTISPECIES: hypothetical protein [Aequorivita]MBB6682281.1 hypothetical protein [Aequorivita sp. 609]